MNKKKIVVIPLDERPCNYTFNQLLVLETDYEVVVPPMEILGDKKKAGNTELITQWLIEHAKDAYGAVIAVDTLVYGGIVPSRLHEDDTNTLIERLSVLKTIKESNKNLKIFAYNLIMRNPKYSSADEEPDYYGVWGREIHLHGVYKHKEDLNIITEAEEANFEAIKKRLPQEYLDDYLLRRDKNTVVNNAFLTYIRDGIIDFGIVPQDDSSPYGLTALDQAKIRKTIEDFDIELKAYMYPGADEVTNVLLARMVNEDHGYRPNVFVKYSSVAAGRIIPLYEDRYLHETLKYQILAAGGMTATSAHEADIVLMVNAPSEDMREASHYNEQSIVYEAFRTLVEFVEYTKYAIEKLNKKVVIADVAYANGGDPKLLKMLKQAGLLYKLSGYAGWNTSSNTIGTCLPQGMIHYYYGDRKAHFDFLGLRYVEDVGYCSFVRGEVSRNLPEGFDYFLIDGKRGHIVNNMIKVALDRFIEEKLNDGKHKVVIKDIYSPWNRMFETGLTVEVIDEN